MNECRFASLGCVILSSVVPKTDAFIQCMRDFWHTLRYGRIFLGKGALRRIGNRDLMDLNYVSIRLGFICRIFLLHTIIIIIIISWLYRPGSYAVSGPFFVCLITLPYFNHFLHICIHLLILYVRKNLTNFYSVCTLLSVRFFFEEQASA